MPRDAVGIIEPVPKKVISICLECTDGLPCLRDEVEVFEVLGVSMEGGVFSGDVGVGVGVVEVHLATSKFEATTNSVDFHFVVL